MLLVLEIEEGRKQSSQTIGKDKPETWIQCAVLTARRTGSNRGEGNSSMEVTLQT